MRTAIVRCLSAHRITLAKSPEIPSGSTSGTDPCSTSPVVPSREIVSVRPYTRSPAVNCPASASIFRSDAPTTQHLPQPRATTAAWLLAPPTLVRMPTAECIPSTSSGLVSLRTRMIFSPLRVRSTASAAVNAGRPTAAPGEAGSPRATTVVIARFVGSK